MSAIAEVITQLKGNGERTVTARTPCSAPMTGCGR